MARFLSIQAACSLWNILDHSIILEYSRTYKYFIYQNFIIIVESIWRPHVIDATAIPLYYGDVVLEVVRKYKCTPTNEPREQ